MEAAGRGRWEGCARGGDAAGAGLLGELVEEGILAVVGGPNGEVAIPGDAALGGFPELLGIGMFGELIEADIAAMDSHGVRVGGEGDDAGAVLEFDVTDFNFFGERGALAIVVEQRDFEDVLAMIEDGASIAEEVGELVNLVHVFEGARPILGGKEVIAVFKTESFADVFKAVGEGPADADGFFGESEDLFFCGVERFFGLDPGDLVRGEVAREERGGIDFDKR